jgi:hypothetical protein
MTRSRIHGSNPGTIISLSLALVLTPILFSAACSDPEQRLTTGDSMSTVVLDLGGAPAEADGIMAAQAPPGIVSVTLTVTGPGMTMFSITDTSIAEVSTISVPSGPARLFTVRVETLSEFFIGTAVAYLPAGATVSVPIVMEWGGWIGPGPQ